MPDNFTANSTSGNFNSNIFFPILVVTDPVVYVGLAFVFKKMRDFGECIQPTIEVCKQSISSKFAPKTTTDNTTPLSVASRLTPNPTQVSNAPTIV